MLLIAAGIFLFIGESGKEDIPENYFDIFKSKKKPEILPPKTLPRVAVVMDDLGTSRELAEKVLVLNGPLTLSILPRQRYSTWTAKEGTRLGLDIIIHLPMEATRPLKLGEGGLYTWMDDKAIVQIVKEDIRSVPNIIGASNHMGSAFTKDKRAMLVVISELKKRRLFFLDSLTTPETVGFKLAKAQGLNTVRRDIFLDNTDNLKEIEIQWNKLIKIANRRGHAIALAHPKKKYVRVSAKSPEKQ